jgi:hypothetical protein
VPGSPECKKLLEAPTAGKVQIFNSETKQVEERVAPSKILLYEREKGLVVEEPVAKLR